MSSHGMVSKFVRGGNCLSMIWFVGVLALAASASLGCGCWVASVGVDVA